MIYKVVLSSALFMTFAKLVSAETASVVQRHTTLIAVASDFPSRIRVDLVLDADPFRTDGYPVEIVEAQYFNGEKMTYMTDHKLSEAMLTGDRIATYCSALAHNPQGALDMHVNEELDIIELRDDNRLRVNLPSASNNFLQLNNPRL